MDKNNIKVYCKNCKWYKNDIYSNWCCVFSTKNPRFTETTIKYNQIGKKKVTYNWKNKELVNIIFKHFAKNNKKPNFEGQTKIRGQIKIRIGYDCDFFINKNYNCPLYERKWWKFWVKAKRSTITKEELLTITNLEKINF